MCIPSGHCSRGFKKSSSFPALTSSCPSRACASGRTIQDLWSLSSITRCNCGQCTSTVPKCWCITVSLLLLPNSQAREHLLALFSGQTLHQLLYTLISCCVPSLPLYRALTELGGYLVTNDLLRSRPTITSVSQSCASLLSCRMMLKRLNCATSHQCHKQ